MRADLLAACLPGTRIAALAPGLVLFDGRAVEGAEGDAFSVEIIDSADYAADGLAATFPTIGAALAAFPPLALATLDAWEAEEHAAPRPCPDMLAWIAECRADLPGHMADVQTFADHLATLEA